MRRYEHPRHSLARQTALFRDRRMPFRRGAHERVGRHPPRNAAPADQSASRICCHERSKRARYLRSRSASLALRARTRGGEQGAAGLGQRAAAAARRDRLARAGRGRTDRVASSARADEQRRPRSSPALTRVRPEPLQPRDLRLDAIAVDPPLRAERRHARDAGGEIAEIAGPARLGRGGEGQIALARLLVEGDPRRPSRSAKRSSS